MVMRLIQRVAVVLTLAMLMAPALLAAQPSRSAAAPPRRRGQHPAAGSQPGRLPRHDRPPDPALGPGRLRAGAAVRPVDLHGGEEPAGPQVDGRRLGDHLRDLQGLPDSAGQVPADSRAVHRHGDDRLLLADRPRAVAHRDRHHLQPDRHRRQLRRGVVRHPHQHAGQLAHRVCQPRRARRSRCATSRCARA